MASNIIVHEWNGFQINQVVSSFNLNGKLVPAEYVDLGAIAAVGDREVKRFLYLDSTKELIQALSEKDQKSVLFETQGNVDVYPPVITIPGRNGGTFGCVEIALELCGWVNTALKVWGLRTLTKVMSGQEITDADRAEGWAHAAQLGLEFEVEQPTKELKPDVNDPFSRVAWAVQSEQVYGKSADELLELLKKAIDPVTTKASQSKGQQRSNSGKSVGISELQKRYAIVKRIYDRHGESCGGWISAVQVKQGTRFAKTTAEAKSWLKELAENGMGRIKPHSVGDRTIRWRP